jgi:hypothetical protein
MKRCFYGKIAGFLLALAAAGSGAADFPPLSTEISPEHPLFLFEAAPPAGMEEAAAYLSGVWDGLDDVLKPRSALRFGAPAGVREAHAWFEAVLPPLQEADIPVVIRISDDSRRAWFPREALESLLRNFTAIRGVETAELRFDRYPPPDSRITDMPPEITWLIETIDTAARYGRFTHIPLADLHWPRILSNTACAPLYEKIRECRDYVIPGCLERGHHHIARMSAILGLWLEESVAQWAIAADARWYGDAWFAAPDLFGRPSGEGGAPHSLYRAMILNGAMAGAAVYAFSPGENLWQGPGRHHWDKAIRPALIEIMEKGLIARRDFVRAKTSIAYRLAPAESPEDFHLNLRDIDGVIDTGRLIHAAYGMERPGQIPELVLNRGDHHLVPLLPAHSAAVTPAGFDTVVKAGAITSTAQWENLLAKHRKPAGEGTAFICRVGRGLFIMNSRENMRAVQTFTVPDAPAPVRGIHARRAGGTVELSWPFREGDVSYSVFRRIPPETEWTPLAKNIDDRDFTDENVPPDQTAAWSVTALTNETEVYSGAVQYGEYLALSVVESRIAEEVLLTPLLNTAVSAPPVNAMEPVTPGEETAPESPSGWPDYAGLDEEQRAMAEAIIGRIDRFDRALQAEDLQGVMETYATDYEDPQGWKFQYAHRAWQWLFERYNAPRLHRQIREWDFSTNAENGRVNLLLYCRVTAAAISDASGRAADPVISIPRTETAEVWLSWKEENSIWRLVSTNPALPNFRDLLSYSAGPWDHFPIGPDHYRLDGAAAPR